MPFPKESRCSKLDSYPLMNKEVTVCPIKGRSRKRWQGRRSEVPKENIFPNVVMHGTIGLLYGQSISVNPGNFMEIREMRLHPTPPPMCRFGTYPA